MKNASKLVFLDEKLQIKRMTDEFWPIELFFITLEYRDTLKRLSNLLDMHGLGFDTISCDVYNPPDDPDIEPYEVSFRISHWGDEPDEVAYVTWEQFHDLLRLFAKSHIHKHPKDEAKLRQMFEEKGVAFEITDS